MRIMSVFLAALLAPVAAAQDAPQWGAADLSYVSYPAWTARPMDSAAVYFSVNTAGGQGIARASGNNFYKIPVHLPSGALVTEIELNYCDDSDSFNITAHWYRQPKNAPFVATMNVVQSAGTPGCVVQTGLLGPPQTIDNDANSYSIELVMNDSVGAVVFLSARVGYRLQVSPSPAVATFPNDVPTSHPFFRFVEALAAAGITAGCGPGAYCPDQPLTRGQMAVFMAAALGLHFPN